MKKKKRITGSTSTFEVVAGARAAYFNRGVVVVSISSGDLIQVRFMGSDEVVWASVADLAPYLEDAQMRVIPHLTCADPVLEKRCADWASGFKGMESKSGSHSLSELAKAMGVSLRTAQRRYRIFRSDPSPGAQINTPPGRAPGTRSLPAPIEKIVDLATSEIYESPERKPISAVKQRVDELCEGAGLSAPSYSAVRARIRSQHGIKQMRKRYGMHKADALLKPATTGLVTSRPLEVVQIDHARVDVHVVHPETRQVIGRPWITLAIDVYTRCIMGFHLSLDAPNHTAVGLTISHACRPKQNWLKEISVSVDYPMYGMMESIHWDNAKEFHTKEVKAQCQRFGIGVNIRPVRKPHYGAYIERLIGTFSRKVKLLPGTSFSNAVERGDYDSEESAALTMSELNSWIILELAGKYHNEQHRGLQGATPRMMWDEAWRKKDGSIELPRLISDPKSFFIGFLPTTERMVRTDGISLNTLRYWDSALSGFIGNKKKYMFHSNDRDLSRIFMADGDSYIEIPSVDRTMGSFSKHELNAAKRSLRKEAKGEFSTKRIFEALREQRELVDNALTESKRARRDHAKRKANEAQKIPGSEHDSPVDKDPVNFDQEVEVPVYAAGLEFGSPITYKPFPIGSPPYVKKINSHIYDEEVAATNSSLEDLP